MFDKNNPAGRLHTILSKGKKLNGPRSMLEFWAFMSGASTSDFRAILSYIMQLNAIADEIEYKIHKLPRETTNHDLLLHRFSSLRAAINNPNFNGQYKGFQSFLDETVLTDLAYCADAISRHFKECEISKEEISEVLADVDNLKSSIGSSALPNELKDIILDLCETIRRALAEYEIRGAERLREVVSYSIGEVLRYNDLFKTNSNEQNVGKFKKILLNIEKIMNRAAPHIQSLVNVKELLP